MVEGLKLNVLQRKMFKAGDVVTTGLDAETISLLEDFGVDNPSNLSADELESEIIRIENELNNPALIGKGGLLFDYTNPLDYLAGAATLTGIGAVGAGAIKSASTAAKGTKIANTLAKLKKLKKSLSVIKGKKPGVTKPGVKGFQPRPRFDPRSYQYDTGKLGLYGTSGGLALGLSQNEYESLPEEIQEALNELQEQKDEAEFDVETGSEGKSKDSEGITDSEIAKLQDLYLEAQTKASEDYKKQKKTFDKQNVFLEEVSDALAEGGGDIGYGLSTGAAKAAKRLSEEEAAAAELEAKLLEDAKDKNTLSTTDKTKIAADYSEAITHLDNMGFISSQIDELEEAVKTGQVTGFKGITGRVLSQIKGFTGFGDQDINDAAKSKQILEFVRAQLIRELLNESGRTISNLDRQLIRDITGDIENLGAGRGVLLEALKRIKDRIRTAVNKSRNQVAFIDAEFGSQLPNLAIYREGFGQRAQTNQSEEEVVVTQEDVIDVTEET